VQNKVLRAKKKRIAKAKRVALMTGVLTTAAALTMGAAAPSPTLVATDPATQFIGGNGNIQLASVVSALAEVIEAYAAGKPPAEFPAELTALLPGLDQIGPQLLTSLGSDQNTEFIKNLSLVSLLTQLGVALPDGLELSLPDLGGLDLDLGGLGLNIITTGGPFFLLNTLGLDLGTFVPAFPNQIADEINDTEYIDLDLGDVPNPSFLAVVSAFRAQNPSWSATKATRAALAYCTAGRCGPDTFPLGIPNLRLPITLGWGIGALATGMAWDQVVADLPNQPGGTAVGAEAGRSLTILTTILMQNPGRANGGALARFAPYLKLFGIDPVTPDFDVEQDGDAVLVPIKVDATVQYDPVADMASWANPFALANNVAAGVFPTYILRGSAVDPLGMVTAVIEPVLPGLLGNVAFGALGGLPTNLQTPVVPLLNVPCAFSCFIAPAFNVPNAGGFTIDVRGALMGVVGDLLGDTLGVDIPDGYFATNEYLTFRQNSLPLLEPARLPFDVANVLFGTNLSNPFADATEEALTSLVALGYTDVVRDPTTGVYTRTLTEAGLNANAGGVPFGTLPDNVDWNLVPGDIFHSLVRGFQKEFLGGGVPGINDPLTAPQANAIAALANLLGLGGLVQGGLINNLPGIGEALTGGLPDLQLPGLQAAASQDNSLQRVSSTSGISQIPTTTPTLTGTKTTPLATDPGTVSSTNVEPALQGEDLQKLADASATQRNRPLLNLVTGTGNPGATTTVGNGRGQLRDAVADTRNQVRDAVTQTRNQLSDAVSGTHDQVKSVLNHIGEHVNDTVRGARDGHVGGTTSTSNDEGKGTQDKGEQREAG
jgi:hypothetical protein